MTIPLDGWGEGASLTFSRTTGLTDGQTIHLTGKYRGDGGSKLRLGEVIGRYAPSPEAGNPNFAAPSPTETADKIVDLGVDAPELGKGWLTVDQDFTITQVVTEPDTGTSYDGAQHQLYLALGTEGGWQPEADGPLYELLGHPGELGIPFTPITFAGGAETLESYEAVAITQQPTDATVAEGETASFSVGASGTPDATYQWQQTSTAWPGQFEDVPGATSATLKTAAMSMDDGLQYRVVVSNRLGTALSNTVTLKVTSSDDVEGVKYMVPLYPDTDDEGRPQGKPIHNGSYVKLSGTTGLHEGDQISVSTFTQTDDRRAKWTFVAESQSDNNHDSNVVITESPLGILPFADTTNAAAKRYFNQGTYTVHDTLTRDGRTVDCKTTQCYLAVFGAAADAQGARINLPTDEQQTDGSLVHLFTQYSSDSGISTRTDRRGTMYIPLYFADGTLTPEPWVAPSFTTQPADTTVDEGYSATFTTEATGSDVIEYQWQYSADGGKTWTSILRANTASYQVSGSKENNGWQYRVRAQNNGGTTYSNAATLTVKDAGGNYDNPDADVSAHGISLTWFGDQVVQEKSPAYYPNYFSAGVSEGAETTYKNADGDVVIGYRDSGTGDESVQTYAQRARSNAGKGQQFVRFNNGTVAPSESGGKVSWAGSFSINFYGGLAPFTVSNPVLTWDADGKGTLKGDLSGYGSSMENPTVKAPIESRANQTIATFKSVRMSSDGVLSVTPDYLGVKVDVGDSTPQDMTGEYAGSWPQDWINYQILTGLDSYWYSSGTDKDSKKIPFDFTVTGLKGSDVVVPAVAPDAVAAPTLDVSEPGSLTATWTAPANDGGAAVSGYTVTLTGLGSDATPVSVEETSLSHTFTGLAAGEYTVTVVANNSAGASAASEAATATVTAAVTEGALAWSVTDEAGVALSGSEWTLTGPDGTATAVIDNGDRDSDPAVGAVKATDLALGDYTVTQTKAATGHTPDSKPRTATLSATNASVALGPVVNAKIAGEISWNATDEDGTALVSSSWSVKGADGKTTTVVDNGAGDSDPAVGALKVTGLAWGETTVTQTKAPDGFVADSSAHTVTIDAEHTSVALGTIVNVKKGDNPPSTVTMTLSASSVQPGGTVEVALSGLKADATYALALHSDEVKLADVTAKADGTAAVTVTIPADAEIGDHAILARDGSGATVASQPLAITAAPVTGEISWAATDKSGAALAGSQWSVTGPDGVVTAVVDNGTNDADPAEGALKISQLAAGDYSVVETKAPTGYVLDTTARSATITAKKPVVALDAIAHAMVAGEVSWTVTDEGGAALSNSEWTVAGPDGKVLAVVDNGDGDADPAVGAVKVSGLAWGEYTVTQTKAPEGYVADTSAREATIDAEHTSVALGAVANAAAGDQKPDAVTLALSASSVAAGGTVDVTLSGLKADATYALALHSDEVKLADVTAKADGTAAVTVTIPADTEIGDHTVLVRDAAGATVASQPLSVTATANGDTPNIDPQNGGAGTTPGSETPTTGDGSKLAHTGADSWTMLGSALALMLVGGGLAIGSTRRRRVPARH